MDSYAKRDWGKREEGNNKVLPNERREKGNEIGIKNYLVEKSVLMMLVFDAGFLL